MMGKPTSSTTLNQTLRANPQMQTVEVCLPLRRRNPLRRLPSLERTDVRRSAALWAAGGATERLARRHDGAARGRLKEAAVADYLKYACFLQRAGLVADTASEHIASLRALGGSRQANQCLAALSAYQTAVALGTFFGQPALLESLPDVAHLFGLSSEGARWRAWQVALSVAGLALATLRPSLFAPGTVVQVSTTFGVANGRSLDSYVQQAGGRAPVYADLQRTELYVTLTPAKAAGPSHIFPVAYERLETLVGAAPSPYNCQYARLHWENMPPAGFSREAPATFVPKV
jgi:hypothetical protein